jgi:hypothetical protein
MKPYGRETKLKGGKPWKVDNHPKKGFKNWWEDICKHLSRSRMKQLWKKDIKQQTYE